MKDLTTNNETSSNERKIEDDLNSKIMEFIKLVNAQFHVNLKNIFKLHEIKDEDSDSDSENDDIKKTHNDIEAKIKGYYNKIIEEINKNSAYSQNNDFNFMPLLFK